MIAWIGTDRREPDLRPPSNSRSARNVVASVALACGAVLTVTVSTAAEVLGPRDASTTPTIPQEHGPAHPVPANQVGPIPVLPPLPAAAQPAVVRQAPQSIPVPPATESPAEITQPAVAPPAAVQRGPVAPAAAPPPVTQRQAAVPWVRNRPDAPAQRDVTSKPDAPRTSPSTRDSRSRQRPPSAREESAREERSELGSMVERTTESVESGLGLR
ncbi:MAG: hypothetical protein M3228_02005 [Actinomycetota bacterium]|nr:hypothetical protein [Actinomycetota bacterium]